jgi:hypothetical protein
MKKRLHIVLLLILAVCVGAYALQAAAPTLGNGEDDDGGSRLHALLKGFNEVPANSTLAKGEFKATINGEDSISFELTYSDLTADALFAHIHLGQKNVNGGVMIFFCDNRLQPQPGAAKCPLRGGTVTGTVTAADVIGPAGQGVSAGEFAKVLQAIRAGVTYANVHSSKFPGGEIRGQVKVVREED